MKVGRIYSQEGLFLSGLLQSNLLTTDEPLPVEHLYSGFLYRKVAALTVGR